MAVTVSKAKIGVCLLGFLGILLLVIGIVALALLPSLIKAMLQENLVLAEGKETFEKWRKTPIPVYFAVKIFNCTNPVGVELYGEKPQVQEVGPFVFKQMRSKDILSWEPDDLTVTYNDLKSYYFVEEESADPNQPIYTLNVPMLGITKFVDKLNYWTRSLVLPAVDAIFENYNESLFIEKPAKTLMFEGYKVELLEDLLNLIKPFATVPSLMPNNTFGFLYGKNNSGDGIFTVYTGEDTIAKYSQIKSWNGNSQLTWWKDQYCDMLNGTDGGQFAPPVAKTDVLYVYTPELCRSVYLEFLEEVHVKGIPAYRFTTLPRLFASPLDNPDNKCFCTRPDLCHLSGILDISSCKHGVPLALSGPHFYLGHPEIGATVEGLHPTKEDHQSYVDIEPTTGLVLRASRKLQVNFGLENSKNYRMTENVVRSMFPLVWVTEEAEVTDELADIFIAKVKTPLTIAKSVLTACIVLGILWIITAAFVTVYILIKQQKAAKSTLKATYKAVPLKAEDVNPKTEKVNPVHI